MDLAFSLMIECEIGASGDADDRTYGGADEQRRDKHCAQKGAGAVLDLGDGHGESSLKLCDRSIRPCCPDLCRSRANLIFARKSGLFMERAWRTAREDFGTLVKIPDCRLFPRAPLDE
jgi:hypothetical protein